MTTSATESTPPAGAQTRPTRFNDATVSGSLGSWFRLFLRYPSPRIIGAALLVALMARTAMGGWRRTDLVVAAAFVVAQPFTEWLLHVLVLHFRPRLLAGRRLGPYISRKHRAHHLDPQDVGLTFVRIPALVGLLVLVLVGVLLGFRDLRLAGTAAVTGYSLLVVYEWSHFLIHSPYVPRTSLYRAVWRSHRLHHFKNEHYWFGVTNPIGDLVLRTYPNRSAVTTSPTARTLGVPVQ